jgi:hypothetical protein
MADEEMQGSDDHEYELQLALALSMQVGGPAGTAACPQMGRCCAARL